MTEDKDRALLMYEMWQAGRLPADVVVITVPIERTGYGDFRISSYGPQRITSDIGVTISVPLHEYRHATPEGADIVLGWNEMPPRLIVGSESRRPEHAGGSRAGGGAGGGEVMTEDEVLERAVLAVGSGEGRFSEEGIAEFIRVMAALGEAIAEMTEAFRAGLEAFGTLEGLDLEELARVFAEEGHVG